MEPLIAALASHGLDDAAARRVVVEARELGPELYASALASDAGAWNAYRSVFDALRNRRHATLPLDPIALGGIAWTWIDGPRFLRMVTRAALNPSTPAPS